MEINEESFIKFNERFSLNTLTIKCEIKKINLIVQWFIKFLFILCPNNILTYFT